MGSESPEFRRKVIKMDEVWDPRALRLAQFAEGWIKRAARGEPPQLRVLVGPVGTGKTTALLRARAFLESHACDIYDCGYCAPDRIPSCMYASWPKRATMDARQFDDWFDDASAAQWIILDEVGGETDRYRSGEAVERLQRTLRLAKTKWMLVSTNVPIKLWSERFDERVADRLSASLLAGRYLDLTGMPSYRSRGKV